jgi:hypothetical protein
MALFGGRAGDGLPARQPLRRRSGNRPLGLDGDEASNADRGAALDHGVEVRVRQHRLQERDLQAGLALHRSLPDNSPNHPTRGYLDNLELVFGSIRNRDTALPWADPKDARQVVTRSAGNNDPATDEF